MEAYICLKPIRSNIQKPKDTDTSSPTPVRKNFLAVGTGGGKAVITSRKSMELLITDPEKLRNTHYQNTAITPCSYGALLQINERRYYLSSPIERPDRQIS